MTLISEIITDAYREANILPVGQDPSASEQTEALRVLNRFYNSLIGNEMGDTLVSVPVGLNGIITTNDVIVENYTESKYAPSGSRLMCNLSESTVINLPPNPEDGNRIAVVDCSGNFSSNTLTLSGNGRTIEGSTSTLLNTDSLQREWFYREDTGNWTRLEDFAVDTVFPFPSNFEDFFIIGLATRLNPRNGVALDEQAAMHFKRQRNIFRARYSQRSPQNSEEGLLRLPSFRQLTFSFDRG